jgi:hypothetical protein
MGWGGVQVYPAYRSGPRERGRIRWASQPDRLAPLGRSGLGNDFQATMLATERNTAMATSAERKRGRPRPRKVLQPETRQRPPQPQHWLAGTSFRHAHVNDAAEAETKTG